ncbi:hypothetical protein NQ318_022854 [Aromia moschata]|uniref:Uncharacterized protein n=1 Tax=Aromia moschata TaxID=1265417 RepID=A0AAV8XWH4_9CUCU|nr:hypothetical protein NQ318_022854 [Aromia moschata]
MNVYTISIEREYEVCTLSNETGNIMPDLATLWRWDLEGRNRVLLGFASDLDTAQRILLQNFNMPTEAVFFSRAKVFRWFKAFSEGRESNEDGPRSGKLSSSKTDENADRIRDIVRSDRRL